MGLGPTRAGEDRSTRALAVDGHVPTHRSFTPSSFGNRRSIGTATAEPEDASVRGSVVSFAVPRALGGSTLRSQSSSRRWMRVSCFPMRKP